MDGDAMTMLSAPTQSTDIGELAGALAKAMGEVNNPSRDRTVSIPNRPEYSYATLGAVLDSVRHQLANNGLWPSQILTEKDGRPYLRTVLLHSSGQWLASEMPLIMQGQGNQALGSAITYLRRYALCALLGVASEEDDDANTADSVPANISQRRPARQAPAAAPSAVKPTAAVPPHDPVTGEIKKPHAITTEGRSLLNCLRDFVGVMQGASSHNEIAKWRHENAGLLSRFATEAPKMAVRANMEMAAAETRLSPGGEPDFVDEAHVSEALR